MPRRSASSREDLLRAAGFEVRDVPEGHFCCGSAGAYNMLQPDMAEALGRRKAGHIESTGAAAIAAGNLGCLAQLARFTAPAAAPHGGAPRLGDRRSAASRAPRYGSAGAGPAREPVGFRCGAGDAGAIRFRGTGHLVT